jgi:glutamate carboxypeptidase
LPPTASRAPLDLLAQLVEIPSHVSQPDGVAAVAEIVGSALADAGFEPVPAAPPPSRHAPEWAERVLCPEVGFDALLDPFVWRRQGDAGGELLILADLDAALALRASECRLAVRGSRATGPAVADMKGGLVVLVEAMRRVAEERRAAPSITVVLSADEQAGSLRSRATIERLAAGASWCVCLECGRDGGRLMRSRGHIGVGLLTATGVEAHAGSARGAGINAVAALARGIAAIDGDGIGGRHATVTPTIVSGGRRRSIVPAQASAVLDLRARDARAWEALESRIRAALSVADPGERLRLDVFVHRPGLPATDLTAWFLAMVHDIGARVGVEISAIDSLAAGSSAFVDSTRIPVLDGMGPAGGALMTADEFVEVDTLESRAALLAALVSELGTRSAHRSPSA